MDSPINGALSYRPRIKAAERVIDFVYSRLPVWRDDPNRKTTDSENSLTESLTNYLADEARRDNQPFSFFHQPSAGGLRTVDFSARPYNSSVNSFALPAITVFEAKRLPAPESNRQMEYVIGSDKPYGGVQRFKLGKHGHGSGHGLVAMVGYVQSGTPSDWFSSINSWISELATKPRNDKTQWFDQEKLIQLHQDMIANTARAISIHCRLDEPDIIIRHLWVVLHKVSSSVSN